MMSFPIMKNLSIVGYISKKQYSTTTNTSQFHPRLNSVISQLNMLAPRFLLKSEQIEILTSPTTFYDVLKSKIQKAKSRIFLSSLYVGKNQDDLINEISDAMTKNKDLKLYILIDYLRGTREYPDKSSLTLLSNLLKKFGNHRVDLRLYHTPNLQGITEKLAPKRLNEGFGLQHMKIYGFDDELILSGANLSKDYFTNRQDRYYLFKDSKITNYFFKLSQIISKISHKVNYNKHTNKIIIDWPTSNLTAHSNLDIERFKLETTHHLEPVLFDNRINHYNDDQYQKHNLATEGKEKELHDEINVDDSEYDTIVYPISQFSPLLKPDISTEKPAILRLLSYMDSSSIKYTFTAGYFNMEPEIKTRLLNSTAAHGDIITASPKANSFFHSKGISKYLPAAYLYMVELFLKDVHKLSKDSKISVKEWENGVVNTENGWSYHAKGIWISAPEETTPSITVVGSSNYTKRSYSLDLETNVVLVTRNEELKQKMQAEINNITEHTKQLTLKDFENVKDEDRQIHWGVKVAANLLNKGL